MISYAEFDAFCGGLKATRKVVQWGGAHVWKVGDKVFAIGGWSDDDNPFITFKCTDIGYEVLKDRPGLRPAPYLAPRGAKWIQMHGEPGLSDTDLYECLETSYRLVVAKLTRARRAELGL